MQLILATLLAVCFSTTLIHAQEPAARAYSSQAAQLRVELSIEDPPPFEPGRALRFVARVEPLDRRLEYHFYFGDGTTSGWVRENQARHAYPNIGAFQAVVFVREPTREGAPPLPATPSNRLPITIVPPRIEEPKTPQAVVRLDVSPVELQVGEPVQAHARLDPASDRVEYRFDFGDGEPPKIQPEPAVEHRYMRPGIYEVFVQVQQGNRLLAESERVRITVSPVQAHRLFLEAAPRNPNVGQVVRFTWRMEPDTPDVLYLIDFGDGNQSPHGARSPVEHVYREPREYRVLLRARIGTEEIMSNEVLITVSPAEREGLYLVISVIAGILVILFVTWRIIRRTGRKRERRPADNDTLVEAGISITQHGDTGVQEMEFASPARPMLEVRFNPVSDQGKQVMDQGTIRRKKKEVDHEPS